MHIVEGDGNVILYSKWIVYLQSYMVSICKYQDIPTVFNTLKWLMKP